MKTIAILVIVALIGSSHQQDNPDRAKFRENAEACMKETSADQEVVRKAFRDGEFADDSKLKCFFKCIYQKMGTLDANGKIDLSRVMSRVPPNADKAKMDEILTKCSQLKADDTCQLAFDVAKCMREAWKLIHPNPN
ncbi:hypothetical protein ILUMI_04206 [Ignelater luminosus]|uniref:Uncharacterized protein n=1 Tax=Ignelater luminosus TaxID=2038154 RepID=A0A8K0GES4_IGNLU|nr:hypothetical protein ILUMI_04206 [Ignelater luminosus]